MSLSDWDTEFGLVPGATRWVVVRAPNCSLSAFSEDEEVMLLVSLLGLLSFLWAAFDGELFSMPRLSSGRENGCGASKFFHSPYFPPSTEDSLR